MVPTSPHDFPSLVRHEKASTTVGLSYASVCHPFLPLGLSSNAQFTCQAIFMEETFSLARSHKHRQKKIIKTTSGCSLDSPATIDVVGLFFIVVTTTASTVCGVIRSFTVAQSSNSTLHSRYMGELGCEYNWTKAQLLNQRLNA